MESGFTRVVPPSDGASDDLVGIIQDMIDTAIERLYPRLATVSRANPGQGTIAVQFHDDDFEGQQTKAMTAGVAYDVGDTVLCQPVSPTEWVVTQKFIATPQDRRAVSDQEIRNNAVRRNHIQNGSVTPAHLDRAYPSQQQVQTIANQAASSAVSNRVTQGELNQAIATRQPAGNYPTMGDVNQQITTRVNSASSATTRLQHRHNSSDVIVETKGVSGVTTVLLALRGLAICTYNNRNKNGNPCASQRNRVQALF